MRQPDIRTPAGAEVWRVPIDRVAEWVEAHPERVHQSSRAPLFAKTWRDLYYARVWLAGGDIDDELAVRGWFAVSLRDLRPMPDYPRVYREAEWEVFAEVIARDTPPLNGDGLYDTLDRPILIYQFHGLPEDVVLDVGSGETFAIYAVQLIVDGPRPDHEVAYRLSGMVNVLRERDGMRPLAIASGDPALVALGDEIGGTGLLTELEDGSTVTEWVPA